MASKKFDAPFDKLKVPNVTLVDGKPKFLCQYTGRASDTCVSLPTFLLRESSASTAWRGMFYDNGVLLVWLYDNKAPIDGDDYETIVNYVCKQLGIDADEVEEYTAVQNNWLVNFGGQMSFDEYDKQYKRPADAPGNQLEVTRFLAEREQKRATAEPRIRQPSAVEVVKATFKSDKCVQRAVVYSWPEMGMYLTRHDPEPIVLAELKPFAEHTHLSVTDLPVSNEPFAATFFAPGALSTRQVNTINKLSSASKKPEKKTEKQSKRAMSQLKDKYRTGESRKKNKRATEAAAAEAQE